MAPSSTPDKPAVVQVQDGVVDRVAMLSLRSDGTPDQTKPEIIGDKDAALANAKAQFVTQAVSAVDQAERGVSATDGVDQSVQDPFIADLKDKHEAAAKAAEAAAEKAVGSLHKD